MKKKRQDEQIEQDKFTLDLSEYPENEKGNPLLGDTSTMLADMAYSEQTRTPVQVTNFEDPFNKKMESDMMSFWAIARYLFRTLRILW